MPQQPPLIPFATIVFRLQELCEHQRNGIMQILTPEGKRAEFQLRKGTIVAVRYGNREGIEALVPISEIAEGWIQFREMEIKGFGHAVLPPTKDLLFLLGGPLEQDDTIPLETYGPGEWSLERLRAEAGRLLSRSDIVDMMGFAHSSELSAVLFLVTMDREWYEFVFKNGNILDVVAQTAVGFEAVWAFRQVRAAKYGIRLRRCSKPTDYSHRPPLPKTGELLRFLESPEGAETDMSAQYFVPAAQEAKPLSKEEIASALRRAGPEVELLDEASGATTSPRPAAASPRETQTGNASHQEFRPIREILQYLHGLCKERQTGIMIVVRADRRGLLEFFLDEGRIYDIVCRRQHGLKGLELAKEVTGGRYSFTAREKLPRRQAPEELPPNEEILYQLGLPLEDLGIEQQTKKQVQTPESTDQQPESQTGEKIRILVVDDSALTRKVVAKSLLGQGYEVIEAEDGEKAVARIQDHPPNLVVLDLIMPGMDGYGVLNTIRNSSRAEIREIPVILLTSRNKLFNRIRGRMAGSDEYLTKPFKPDELLSKIRKYVH